MAHVHHLKHWLVLFLCSLIALVPATTYAANPIGDLLSKCGEQRSRVEKPAMSRCNKVGSTVNSPERRKCTSDATASGQAAFDTCMSADPRGSCVAKEYETNRLGCQGGIDRGCALMRCGYSYQDLEALGLYSGWGGGGGGKCAGYSMSCPGAPTQGNTQPQAAKPAGMDMGKCKPADGFKNTGWRCANLAGQASEFAQYNISSSDICTKDQVDALIRANDDSVCTNVIEQRKAMIDKVKAADAAVAMGKCKTVSTAKSSGWKCSALDGLLGTYDAYKLPADQQICSKEQAAVMKRRNNDADCSNIMEQVQVFVDVAKKKAAEQRVAGADAAFNKLNLGTCKPDPKVSVGGGGWECSALLSDAEFDKLKVPSGERICTPAQAKALADFGDKSRCSNVVMQREAVLAKYREKATSDKAKAEKDAALAAVARTDMGKCKPVDGFKKSGWACKDLKGHTKELTDLGVPESEQICTSAQMDAYITLNDAAICSNLIEQRAAVANAYKEKARKAKEAFMGTCKPAAGFDNTGFGCKGGVELFLVEAVKVGVPAGDRICSDEQMKQLVKDDNTAVCSNVARQIDAATKKYKASLAAKPAAPQVAPRPVTPTAQVQTAQTIPAATSAVVDMGNCKPSSKFGNSGWRCSDLNGQIGNYDRYNVPAGERICTPAQTNALAAAKNDGNCSNVIFQGEAVIEKYKKLASASNVMTVNSATYGGNCSNAKNQDVTSKVAGSCNGKEKCPYTVSAGVLGDTAEKCAKAFEAEYTCPSKGKRKITIAAEANNKTAVFDCSK